MRVVPIVENNIKSFQSMLPDAMPDPEGIRTYIGILDEADSPVGAAVVDDTGDVVLLESLFIEPEHRRKGIGRQFIYGLLERRKEVGGVFLNAEFPHSNEAAEEFFLSCGFLLTRAGDIWHFWQKKVIKNKKAIKVLHRNIKGNCKSVQLINKSEKKVLREFIKKLGHQDVILDKKSFQPALSSCVFDDRGVLQAFMLCMEEGHDIIVSLVGGKGKSNTAIFLTFRHLLDCVIKRDEKGKIPEDGRVVFQALKTNVVDMAADLFDGHIESDDFIELAVKEI